MKPKPRPHMAQQLTLWGGVDLVDLNSTAEVAARKAAIERLRKVVEDVDQKKENACQQPKR